jgi:hypothetical protein
MFAALAKWGYRPGRNGCRQGGGKGGVDAMSMTPEPHHHEEPTPVRDPEGGSGLVGYAAIKYVAIVAIVIAILIFLAVYLIPALTD